MTTANVNIKKVLLRRGNTAQNNNYLGVYGEVSVDMEAKTLRIHDGNVAGGYTVTGGGGGTTDSVLRANVGAYQTYSNANAASQTTSINSINANVGAYQIYANANAASQTTDITSLRANIAAANVAITALQSNAAVQQALLDTLTGNAATQAITLNTLTSNAATQADTLITLLSNAVAQQTSLIDLVANAATQAQAIANVSGTYSNSNVKSYLGSFDGNILPSANVTYSLGNATHQWKDLWVSNNTIYVGNTPIRVDGSTLLVNGSPVTGAAGNVASLINGAYTFNLFANGQSRSPDTIFAVNGVSVIDANGAVQGGIYNSGDADFFNIGAGGGRGIKFYVNEEGNGPQFFANGNIQLPANIISGHSYINFVANSSGDGYGFSTIQLRPDTNAYDDSYLIIDPTYPSHIHIRAGGTQDNSLTQLFLGGENSHFRVDSGLNPTVYVRSNNNNWTFGSDGNLTLADIADVGSRITAINNIKLSSGNYQWDFAPDGKLTIPNGGQVGPIQFSDGIDLYASGSMSYAQLNYNDTNYVYADPTGAMLQTGNAFVFADTNNNRVEITASPSTGVYKSWYFGSDGNIQTPNGGLIGRVDTNDPNSFGMRAGGSVNYVELNFADDQRIYVDATTVNIGTNNLTQQYLWQFGQDGTLTLPGGLTFSGSPGPTVTGIGDFDTYNATVFNNLTVANIVQGSNTWQFSSNGNLVLPGVQSPMIQSGHILNVKGIHGLTATSGARIDGFSSISASTVSAANFTFANGVNILTTVSVYGNTEVGAYLPTYTGNLSPSTLTLTSPGQLQFIDACASPLSVGTINSVGNISFSNGSYIAGTTGRAVLANVVSTSGFFWSNGSPYVPAVQANTGNVTFTDTTISTQGGVSQGIILNSSGSGEIAMMDYVGINNTNPGYWLHVGDGSIGAVNNTGNISIDYNNGLDTSRGSTIIGYAWWDAGGNGNNNRGIGAHRQFGIYKNDDLYTTKYLEIDLTSGNANLTNIAVTRVTSTSSQTGNLTITGNTVQQSAYYETYSNVSNSGGNLTCNFVDGGAFYATLTANVTANFTNVAMTTGTIVGATIIVDQGATPYQISNIQINGGNIQTVKWAGGVGQNPGTGSNTDVMSFSLINLGSGAWRVLGQIANYG